MEDLAGSGKPMLRDAVTRWASRLRIGPRLLLCFACIVLTMLCGGAAVLSEFRVVRVQAERINDLDQSLVAVLRLHASLLSLHGRLEELAEAEEAGPLAAEAAALHSELLEESKRARIALEHLPTAVRRDPTILPTLAAVQGSLTSQLQTIRDLAVLGDWRAVRLRLENQIRPLDTLTSALVEKVYAEAVREQAQAVENIERVQRRVFVMVPATAIASVLIALTLGWFITRSITHPLTRLVEGTKALARGDFEHQVPIRGRDELAHLGQAFNATTRRLRDLYAALQSSEDRLRLVIDMIPANVWSTRPDGAVDFVSQRAQEITGLPAADLSGWNWEAAVHPDDCARFLAEWRAALESGRPMEAEVRVRRTDGEHRWCLIRNVPLRGEEGKIVKWYGIAVDIEDRRRAEEERRLSEARFRNLVEFAADAFMLHADDGTVLDVNRHACESLGYSRDELIGMKPAEFDAGLDTANLQRVFERIAAGETVTFETRQRRKDGTVFPVEVRGRQSQMAHGDRRFGISLSRDITERRQAEEERERLRQMEAGLARINRVTTMGELTASLAHEVHQPIAAAVTSANACLRWLAHDPPEVESARQSAARAVREGTRAGEIIHRVRSLYKKSAPPVREPLDVNDVTREMLALLREECQRHSVSARADLAPDLPAVRADRVELQQVFMNLMVNAIEAMDQGGGELVVASRPDAAGVLISVSDTGAGLPAQEGGRIFDPFYTTKRGGTGMGLAISRSIVESHGGRLWATANAGAGAAFHFTLPSGVEHSPQGDSHAGRAPDGGAPRA